MIFSCPNCPQKDALIQSLMDQLKDATAKLVAISSPAAARALNTAPHVPAPEPPNPFAVMREPYESAKTAEEIEQEFDLERAIERRLS